MATAPVETGPRGGYRQAAARGTLINAAFNVAMQALGFLRGWIVAGFLTATQYGVWGLLLVSLGTLLWLAQIGIDDKYIQQDHPDQEKALQLAFTLQCMLAALFMVILAIGVPLFALAYNKPEIIAPGLVLTLAMPTAALDTPMWHYYRQMDFAKQRRLGLWEPLVGFVVTVSLAVAGAGYWALVLGVLCGAWAGAIVAVRASPYKLKLYYEKGTLREYASFSFPIMISNATGVLIAQIPILFVQRDLGTAAVGAITFCGSISLYANRVDEIVTETLYPAIARAKGNVDLLFEAFTKSNRLALMWGVPCGVGIALFAPEIIHYVVGDQWRFAQPMLQIVALTAGFNQFAFNWAAFYKAINKTRPIATAGIIMAVAVIILVPFLAHRDGVRGYAIGMAAAASILLVVRAWYLSKLFPDFGVVRHALPAILPTVPAAALVLLWRGIPDAPQAAGTAAIQAAAYAVILLIGTLFIERALIREVLGYLRGAPAEAAAA